MKPFHYVDDYMALRIKHWDWRNVRSLLKYLRGHWQTQYAVPTWVGDPESATTIVVSTGGNSVNVELIEALRANAGCWEMIWKESKRLEGGAVMHTFEIPEYLRPDKPLSRKKVAALRESGGFLPRLDNRMVRFFAYLAKQGAEAISSRTCEDMLPEAEAIWSDDEKLELMTRYEQWNSKGEQEPEWTPQGWILLGWLAEHLLIWADEGKALEPVDAKESA